MLVINHLGLRGQNMKNQSAACWIIQLMFEVIANIANRALQAHQQYHTFISVAGWHTAGST